MLTAFGQLLIITVSSVWPSNCNVYAATRRHAMNTSTQPTRIDKVLTRQRRSLVLDRLALLGMSALTLMNIVALF
jgi:hypothetical protein